MTMLADLTPSDLGLPAHYTGWRDIQGEVVEHIVYSDKRFIPVLVPTGGGKSLIAATVPLILQERACIITGTKGLQDQYNRDLNPNHIIAKAAKKLAGYIIPSLLTDIRGKSNYDCIEFKNTCDAGGRVGCALYGSLGCTHGSAMVTAKRAGLVGSNYDLWLHVNNGRGKGLINPLKPNPFGILILDEAHLADKKLAGFLSIKLYDNELKTLLMVMPPKQDDLKDWVQFAKDYKDTAKLEYTTYKNKLVLMGKKAKPADIKHVVQWENLTQKLEQISRLPADGWVCEQENTRTRVWKFDPIWPGLYAESNLFLGIPKIILMSATLHPKTMALLGVKKQDYDYRAWKKIFPASRGPVIHVPTVRLNKYTKPPEYVHWMDRIDEIIGSRLDRKGIIHTVSYDRQKYITTNSKYSQWFIKNTDDPNSDTAAKAFEKFKKSGPGHVLVSPSFGTGWDFPGKDCEYQIIVKVPFPPAQSLVMKARLKKDPQYTSYLTMQELVQAAGRGQRSMTDRCETFIIDDAIGFFMGINWQLAPEGFTIRKSVLVPKPPPLLI